MYCADSCVVFDYGCACSMCGYDIAVHSCVVCHALFQDSHHPVNLLQEKKLISADGMEIIHPPSFSDAAQVLRNPE